MVSEADSSAFVTISDVREVMGATVHKRPIYVRHCHAGTISTELPSRIA
ncbi:MAG: hypothetical protein HQL05_01515 [Nitrospirae bacterium]|nr:hypothetical protein [Nitrospirota bacterium]